MKILMIDRSLAFAQAFEFYLEHKAGIEVTTICTNVDDALVAVREYEVDLIILDAGLNGRGPLAVVNQVNVRGISTPFILLAEPKQLAIINKAFSCGAKGAFSRNETIQNLTVHVQKVASKNSQRWLSAEFGGDFTYDAENDQFRATFESASDQLTPRQMEVFQLLAEGLTVKQAAERMHLSEKSVDSHKYRIMTRLDIHDRVALTRLAIREGIIEP